MGRGNGLNPPYIPEPDGLRRHSRDSADFVQTAEEALTGDSVVIYAPGRMRPIYQYLSSYSYPYNRLYTRPHAVTPRLGR